MTTRTNLETQQAIDQQWMDRALRLARMGRGRVAPNPTVGTVIVRDGEVVGEGHTEPAGQRHAEIVALDQAGENARGGTMYVTLEPCAHYGRTPPCVDAVLEAGITRIVVAIRDPFPLVNGKSIARMHTSGLEVVVGIGAEEAARINAGFFKRVRTGLPEVHVKYAMSLDGKIATHTGHSKWITGPDARREAHKVRDESDAILVGIGTVLADDPLLTTRLDHEDAGTGGPHHPLRVVADRRARTPVDAAMLKPDTPGSTLIAIGESAPRERVDRLRNTGAEILTLPEGSTGIDLNALLEALGQRGVNTVMVEGGSQLIGSLADERLIDRVTAFIAPVILGGQGAASPVSGIGAESVHAGLCLTNVEIRKVGGDICVSGYVADQGAIEGLLTCLPGS